uniref:Uncharacterized protein n=1 Tax=Heterorhabditis bacteriophora TaxID=37862 RepID=A0A1I7WA69_HETBA
MEKELLKQVVSVPNIFQFFGIPICFINFIVNPLQICKYDVNRSFVQMSFNYYLKSIFNFRKIKAEIFISKLAHKKRPVRITSPDSTRMYQKPYFFYKLIGFTIEFSDDKDEKETITPVFPRSRNPDFFKFPFSRDPEIPTFKFPVFPFSRNPDFTIPNNNPNIYIYI